MVRGRWLRLPPLLFVGWVAFVDAGAWRLCFPKGELSARL